MSDLTLIIWIIAIGIGIYQYQKRKKDEKEISDYQDQKRRDELKELFEKRKTRENQQLFEEKKFWEIIEDFDKRSFGSYKNQLGLFKDFLRKLSPDQLLEMDNLINHLIRKGTNWDVAGASLVILKSHNFETVNLLISWLISKGEVFFNNSIIDVNVILNKEIIELTEFTYSDVIADMYYSKTKELIPLSNEVEITVKGTEWQENEIPSRFEKLWDVFA